MNRRQRRAQAKAGTTVLQEATPNLQQLVAEALQHHHAGRLPEAERLYRQILAADSRQADALHFLGVLNHQVGRNDVAVELINQAIGLNGNVAAYHSNLAVALIDLECLVEAAAACGAALRITPDLVEAHSNLGTALKYQGRLYEAVAACRAALCIKPDYAEAHSNLGNALCDLGCFDDAVASYGAALRLKPDYAKAHSNLGIALRGLGRLVEAVAACGTALCIKPDLGEALANLAVLHKRQGNFVAALNTIIRCVRIKETVGGKRIFVECAQEVGWQHDVGEIRTTIVRALTEPWGRPSQLAKSAGRLIKLNPDLGGAMVRAANAWPQRLSAQDLFGPGGVAAPAADPLLHALLISAPISDIDMERFLTMSRRTMLDRAAGMTSEDSGADTALSFYCALARQCFINEYVFSYTDDEFDKASELRDSLVAALAAKTRIPALWPVAVAAYFPLGTLSLATQLMDVQWPDEVAAALVQQVLEPEEERQLAATIPRLTSIDGDVSLLVQNQYEENPYPRWMRLAADDKPMPLYVVLRQLFPLATIEPPGMCDNPDILIAGCGTGQHSINTALRFQGARILAVDLSMASLCYAKRKTQEMGLTSIAYAQADLLQLGALGRRFDVIESLGVLHHLAEPLAGWRVLLSLLRSGGFMKLGLYSEVARRNIVKVRDFIAEQGYRSTAEDIRRCRRDLADLDGRIDFRDVINLPDYFSVSGCRDLLFHVQEHRITLKTIEDFIVENNLKFMGFEITHNFTHAYNKRFKNDIAANNLKQWEIFESENPDTFLSMYQFWVQKLT